MDQRLVVSDAVAEVVDVLADALHPSSGERGLGGGCAIARRVSEDAATLDAPTGERMLQSGVPERIVVGGDAARWLADVPPASRRLVQKPNMH